MDWAAVRGFVAVVQEGSFSAAARDLFVTQSALSKQVRRLEAQLGVQLLERPAGGVGLTVAGAAALEAAEELSATWERLVKGLRRGPLPSPAPDADGGSGTGALRLGAFTRDNGNLTELLRVMLWPTPVRLTVYHPGELFSAFAARDLDAIFTHTCPGQPLHVPPGASVRTVVHVPIWALLGRNHPYADRAHVTVGDLNDAGTAWFVTPEADTHSWDLTYLNSDSAAPPAQTVEMTLDWRAALDRGDRAALVTASAVSDSPTHVAVPLLPAVAAHYCVIWNAQHLPDTTADRLLAALRAFHRYRAHQHTRYWDWIHHHPTRFPGIALQAGVRSSGSQGDLVQP